jgi:hypothetical protein
VNKWDLSEQHTSRIETLSRRRGAEVVGRLPFDPEVPKALARGELPLVVPSIAAGLEECASHVLVS